MLIDLDPQGNASTAAGIPKRDKNSLYNHYFDNKKIKEGLTVRDLSNLSLKSKSKQNSRLKQKDTDVLNIEKEMSEIFGHKIEIEAKNTKTGKVSIIYKTLDELDNIISKIKNK